jgi:hypothetical protein
VASGLGITNGRATPTLSLWRASALWALRWLGTATLSAIAARPWIAPPATTVTATSTLPSAFTLTCLTLTHPLHHFGARSAGCGLHHVPAWWRAGATPNGLATHRNGFAFFTLLGTKTVNYLHRNGLLGKTLDVLHEPLFIQAHQIDSCTVIASAPCPSNAMNIVFADVWNFIVDDVWQVIDINAAGGDVGCYQCTHVTTLESRKCLRPCSLTLIAV